MRRTIEELIGKREHQQEKLKQTLSQLGSLLDNKGILKKKGNSIQPVLDQLNSDINDLITLQDKEWDAYSNNHYSEVFKAIHWKIGKLEAEYSHMKSLLSNFVSLEKSLEKLIDSVNDKCDAATRDRLEDIKGQLSVYQYSDFEQRFRGDQESVKQKLSAFIPIFKETDDILDVGCGRGEFIELLQKEGKRITGIDISDSMLKEGETRGITGTQKADALQYLSSLGEQSLGGIFSSQVIEHFEPHYLIEFVLQCQRVLKSGSPMVLETINPLSLYALSQIFYLDITHTKPLHPEYMRYLLEISGFGRVDIQYGKDLGDMRLETVEGPNARIYNTNVDKLNHLIFSAPNYAVIGYKP